MLSGNSFSGCKGTLKVGDDFKGMKYRGAGLTGELFTAMGASIVTLPSNQLAPESDRDDKKSDDKRPDEKR